MNPSPRVSAGVASADRQERAGSARRGVGRAGIGGGRSRVDRVERRVDARRRPGRPGARRAARAAAMNPPPRATSISTWSRTSCSGRADAKNRRRGPRRRCRPRSAASAAGARPGPGAVGRRPGEGDQVAQDGAARGRPAGARAAERDPPDRLGVDLDPVLDAARPTERAVGRDRRREDPGHDPDPLRPTRAAAARSLSVRPTAAAARARRRPTPVMPGGPAPSDGRRPALDRRRARATPRTRGGRGSTSLLTASSPSTSPRGSASA